ncbi:MAG TPA: YciI family protein [Pseudomonadales bacterium]
MKYVCLVYGEEGPMRDLPDSDCAAYAGSLQASGHLLVGQALQPVETATTVRVRNGKTTVVDGPFAETKEQLAGFYLIDAADLDEAIRIASGIPPARIGSIEVRPARELDV